MGAFVPFLQMLATSKTMQGAHVALGTVGWELVPKILAGDPTSIGLGVLATLAWARTAYGRWVATKVHTKGK